MQIDWWTLALQTVNFLIVVWLLSRFLYRPVRRMIDTREAADRRAAEDAAAKAEQAETARQEYESKRAALEDEARRRQAAFDAEMQDKRAALIEDARSDAEKMLAEARDRLERDRTEALKQLHGEIAGLASTLARRALEAQPASADDAIAQTMERIDGLTEEEVGDLTRDLGTETTTLAVVSASPLTSAEQERWRSALGERFGSAARVTFEHDPDILGGHSLRFPHAVLDLSVAGRLKRAASGMEA